MAVTGRAPRVVPNAISARPAPAPRTGRPTVVFVGRLDEPRKGYDRFTRLASTGLDAHFVAVGPGGRGADGVEELGQVSEADLAAVLGRASVLVAPSRFGESFGMILIEALASGCAVVASDLPGYRAALAHSTVTSWVHVEDQAGLGAALAARLDEPADPSVAWAEASPFFWPAVGPAVLRAYRDALKPPPRSSTMAR